MSNLTEKDQWEDGIYQLETSDPVLGGPDGVSNKPAKQLANRTLWLKKQQEKANEALKAHERSRNHPDGTTAAKGFVQLSDNPNLDSSTLAATPKAVKAVNDAAAHKAANLADLTDKSKARQNLGLKSAALRDVGTADGQVMPVGAGGLCGSGWESWAETNADLMKALKTRGSGFFRSNKESTSSPTWGPGIFARAGDANTLIAVSPFTGQTVVMAATDAGLDAPKVNVLYGTANKPTATDVNAWSKTESDNRYLQKTGGTVTGKTQFNGGIDFADPNTGITNGTDGASYNGANLLLKSWNGIGFYKTIGEKGITGFIDVRTGDLRMKRNITADGQMIEAGQRVYSPNNKPKPGDLNVYSKPESDGRYFARGTTATTKDVAWNAASGVYNTQADGMTMVVHFAAGGTGSVRAADFKFSYANGGLAFRSSRDGFGYENGWTKVYTDRQRPTAAEVQAADVRNNFAAKMGANRTLSGDAKPTAPGVWSVENSKWAPEGWGTMLYTTNRPDLKVDTGNGQFHHYLFLSHNRKLWVATNINGNWSGWQVMYSTSNKPTAADTGALPLTGGNLTGPVSSTSWLSATALTATYHTTTADKAPEGSGAFVAQLDSKAPFYQANFDWVVAKGGHYVPLVKGRSNRKGQGYPTAVSFGYLLDGTPDFAHPCIHVKADNAEALWRFNPSNGSITSKAGTVATQEWVNTHCPFPVGYVMLMGNGNDPNALYPGTRWQDLNATGFDGRVISLGYDAMGLGGNNKVTIGAHNLPDHSHRGGMNAPGNEYDRTYTGTDNTGGCKLGITSHTYTNSSGAEIVRNEPIDVTNAYVHVRGWMRTA